MPNQLTVYVLVSGTPTDPLDADLPGIYAHTISVPQPLHQLPLQDAAICTAVLDEFHRRQGVEVLDDFSIRVVLVDGREIQESDEPQVSLRQGQLVVEHEGKVTDAEVPAAVSAALTRSGANGHEV